MTSGRMRTNFKPILPGMRTILRGLPLFLILFLSLFTLGARPYQQSAVDFVAISQNWDFGQEIHFRGTIRAGTRIKETVLFIKPFDADTRIVPIQIRPDGGIDHALDPGSISLRAFTPVEYWYQVTLENNQVDNSPVYSFVYEDNRFDWQRMESDQFKIAWASGDLEFGQTLMNTAENSLTAALSILPIDFTSQLHIYVYPSIPEFQTAVDLAALPWAAGQATPDIDVILLSIPQGPDARAEMERQIPHEIMHILEYQIVGAAYRQTPIWLLEGLASYAELYPNPEYQRVLQTAVDEDSLVPMLALCEAFPRDLSGAVLAYAQSSSFVRFLHQNYGGSGIIELFKQYQDGMGCEAGVQAAFGTSFSQVETRWKSEALDHNLQLAAWRQIRPYLLLAMIILIPVGVSLVSNRRKGQNGK